RAPTSPRSPGSTCRISAAPPSRDRRPHGATYGRAPSRQGAASPTGTCCRRALAGGPGPPRRGRSCAWSPKAARPPEPPASQGSAGRHSAAPAQLLAEPVDGLGILALGRAVDLHEGQEELRVRDPGHHVL